MVPQASPVPPPCRWRGRPALRPRPSYRAPSIPGLAAIEAGYARWKAMRAQIHALRDHVDELVDQAHADLAPLMPPKPERAPEIVAWICEVGFYTRGSSAVPRRLRGEVQAHFGAMIDHRHACNAAVEGHPAYERAGEIEDELEDLSEDEGAIRTEVLQIPTTSPRGLLIKFAIAVYAETLDEIEDRLPLSLYGSGTT